MDDVTKFFITIAICVVLIAGLIVFGTLYTNYQFVSGNYCQGTVNGQSGTVWIKCEEKK